MFLDFSCAHFPQTTEMGVPEAVKRTVFVQETPHAPAPNGSYPPQPVSTNGFNVYLNGTFWELFSVLSVLFGLSMQRFCSLSYDSSFLWN